DQRHGILALADAVALPGEIATARAGETNWIRSVRQEALIEQELDDWAVGLVAEQDDRPRHRETGEDRRVLVARLDLALARVRHTAPGQRLFLAQCSRLRGIFESHLLALDAPRFEDLH